MTYLIPIGIVLGVVMVGVGVYALWRLLVAWVDRNEEPPTFPPPCEGYGSDAYTEEHARLLMAKAKADHLLSQCSTSRIVEPRKEQP